MKKRIGFGFNGDDAEFVKRIARKYELSENGIKEITFISDKIQLERRFEARLKEKFPGAKLKWNNTDKSKVFTVWMNENLDIFGFAKIVMPEKTEDGQPIVVSVPFHMTDPIQRVMGLF